MKIQLMSQFERDLIDFRKVDEAVTEARIILNISKLKRKNPDIAAKYNAEYCDIIRQRDKQNFYRK